MKQSSRRTLLTLAALAISLPPLSAQAGSRLSSSAQRRLPSQSPSAEFNRILFPDSTYMIDDGVSDDSVGLTLGGDLICLNEFPVIPGSEVISSVSLAWGSPMFPDPTLDGLPYTAVLWSDPNGDGSPTDAVVLATASGVVSNQGTDTFVTTDFPPTLVTTPNFFVGFVISHGDGQLPAAFDESEPTLPNRSYAAGGAMGDFHDLNNNEIPVAPIESFGLVGNWLIRADATSGGLFLRSAVSRKVHASRGTFDIPLPLGGLGIEDRDTPTDTIVFDFSGQLTGLDGATASCGTVVSATVDPANAHDVVVEIAAADCDEQVITVTLSGLHDDQGNTLEAASVDYGKLIGDVDASGVVNFADVELVRAGRSQKTKTANFRLDVNADGGVNGPDLGIVKDSRRHALP